MEGVWVRTLVSGQRDCRWEETYLRIVEPVGPAAAVPPAPKNVEGILHSQRKPENPFIAIFQEVSNRCRLAAGRSVSSGRIPFLRKRGLS